MRYRMLALFMMMACVLLPATLGETAGQTASAQGGQDSAEAKPVPRWADGTPRLGGEKGIWLYSGGGGGGGGVETPYQPWARAVAQLRRQEMLEPHTRCKPSGGVRQFLTPYGVEILHRPELQRIFIFDIGGPHSVRTIYLDGREHPKDLVPTYYGHNVGRWEGDTLVVESTGYNEKFWIDRGQMPHTEQLRVTERFTRTSYNSMTYEITIDDPGAYTEPFTRTGTFRFQEDRELFEFICQDNNFAFELMVGTMESVDRSTPFIP